MHPTDHMDRTRPSPQSQCREPRHRPHFHIILHRPLIPNNTGAIGRTCVATGCVLHLIRPLGFDTSVKACRRAGLDYWPRLAPMEHDSWEMFTQWHEQPRRNTPGSPWLNPASPSAAPSTDPAASALASQTWFFSTGADRLYWDAEFRLGDRLVFGNETDGLPEEILAEHPDSSLRLPMIFGERSLNLANVVCAVIYEGLRQRRGDPAAKIANWIVV